MKQKKDNDKVPMAMIYRQGDEIKIEFTEEGNRRYEMYGFLKCFLKLHEQDLLASFEDFS